VGAQRSEGRPARSAGEVVDQHGEGNMAAREEECGAICSNWQRSRRMSVVSWESSQFLVFDFNFQKLSC
jgi:hypothetical protein